MTAVSPLSDRLFRAGGFVLDVGPRDRSRTSLSPRPRSVPLLVWLLLSCCIGGLAPRLVQADTETDPTDALRQTKDLDTHVQHANQAVREERHAVAANEWALSYVLQPTPEFLFNLAEACRKLNDLRDARFYYERYLRESPQGALRSQAGTRLSELSNYPAARNAATGQLFSEHQNQGLQQYTQQNFGPATKEFAMAYALAPRLQLLPNLGRALQRAGQLSEALTVYQTFLRSAPPGPERDKLGAIVAQLREQLRPPALPEVPENPTSPAPVLVGPPPAVSPQAPVASLLPGGQLPAPPPIAPAGAPPVSSPKPRPPWASYFEVRTGLLASGRQMQFEALSNASGSNCLALQDGAVGRFLVTPCPRYTLPVALGIHLAASVFPLAGVRIHALRGLGVSARLDIVPSAQACANPDEQGGCPAGMLGANQLRAEVGLRWRWLLGNVIRRPSLSALIQYGFHRWAFDPPGDTLTFRSLPSTTYQYADIGLGLEAPLWVTSRVLFQMELQMHYHAMVQYGDVARGAQTTEDSGYGPIDSGHGLRVDFIPMDIRPWKGLSLRVSSYYELFMARFAIDSPGMSAPTETRFIAQGFQDHCWGGMLTVGYAY